MRSGALLASANAESGEDPLYIARRLVVCIGRYWTRDPRALRIALVRRMRSTIGLPEAACARVA
jgi:replication-associated recombination protein RarA